jgi:hypothetical protein
MPQIRAAKPKAAKGKRNRTAVGGVVYVICFQCAAWEDYSFSTIPGTEKLSRLERAEE